MDDRDKEIFERLAALETNRTNDQEAIKLLREEKKDTTTTYLALVGVVGGVLSLVMAGVTLIMLVFRSH
jgi:hypothetical protein